MGPVAFIFNVLVPLMMACTSLEMTLAEMAKLLALALAPTETDTEAVTE